MNRRGFLSTAVLAAPLAAALARPAQAGTEAPFTQAAFEAAKAANKPILIAVHADWCPTCTRQKPVIEGLRAQPAFKDLAVLVVDFDSQQDVCQALGVRMQSTLIAFHGKEERGRAVGITSEDAIKALMLKTGS